MHCKTRENWPFSGLFFNFRVILTSGGHLLKIAVNIRRALNGSRWKKREKTAKDLRKKTRPPPLPNSGKKTESKKTTKNCKKLLAVSCVYHQACAIKFPLINISQRTYSPTQRKGRMEGAKACDSSAQLSSDLVPSKATRLASEKGT